MVINQNTIKTEGAPPLLEEVAVRIETLPNLRRVDPAGKLYRSSRQDLLSPVDADSLSHLGIRSVVDFRSKSEYSISDGDKIFDRDCDIVEVIVPKGRGRSSLEKTDGVPVRPVIARKKLAYKKGANVSISTTDPDKTAPPRAHQDSAISGALNQLHLQERRRRRYLLNFYRSNYIFTVFRRVPIYKQLYSLLFLIVDVIFRTHFRYFVRYFAKEIVNPAGLLSSYIDMLELSSMQICLALRILSEPHNLPALVSCAHGKDRTGIVVALVLALLGKTDEYIAQEYALSEEGLDPVRSRLREEIVGQKSMDESFTHARQETMRDMFTYIHTNYGSVPDYLESIGFTRDDQVRLVKTFQE